QNTTTAENGFGICGDGNGGPGTVGRSTTHDGVQGSSQVAGKSGVWGHNEGEQAGGFGVYGNSGRGYGAGFQGGLAPLLLVPSNVRGSPTAATGNHVMGELYVDSEGDLYFCKQAGTPGTWKRVQLV